MSDQVIPAGTAAPQGPARRGSADTRRSAEILPFRARAVRDLPEPAPAAPPAPQPGAERLRLALEGLEAALAAQREAFADWRRALAELQGSVGGLGQSLQGYNAALGTLAQDVGRLNGQARALEATADAALRHNPA